MTKIMLVEDDKSLREIYGVRLLAEGYDIVSAGDGEEALAMAIKERPQLIISDVMMPKVSGYDMLDILRSTTETKNIRVIMMTALSSEEQRQRAETLGADRYLVKSQVGIEDVVRVVHEVLADNQPAPAPANTQTPSMTAPVTAPPRQPAPTPLPAPGSVSGVPAAPTPKPALASSAPKPASLKTRVIQPLNDPNLAPVNINDLLDKELAREAGLPDSDRPVVESINQEKAELDATLQAFSVPAPTPVEAPPVTVPAAQQTQPSVLPTPGIAPTPVVPEATVPIQPQSETAPIPAAPTPVMSPQATTTQVNPITPQSTPMPAPTPTPAQPITTPVTNSPASAVTPQPQVQVQAIGQVPTPVQPSIAPQPTQPQTMPSPSTSQTPTPITPQTTMNTPQLPEVPSL